MEFEIVKTYGVLSTNDKNWSVELNLVKWNGREPTFDIRAWNEDHTKCGKGKTFNKDELIALSDILIRMKEDGVVVHSTSGGEEGN